MGMMRHHRPVTTQRREGAVSVQASLMLVNDRFGDMRCVATKALSRLRTDAASAKVGNPRSVLSRTADLYPNRSELPLSAQDVALSYSLVSVCASNSSRDSSYRLPVSMSFFKRGVR